MGIIKNKEQQKVIITDFPPEYIETLKLKNYCEPTIKTYRQHFNRFLRYFEGIEVD